MSNTMKRLTLIASAGAFVVAVGLPAARADETVIEKRTEESHSYKVEPASPTVIERRTTVEAAPADVVTEHTTVERVPAPVIEKHTTVETVPAAPVIEKRTTETIHSNE